MDIVIVRGVYEKLLDKLVQIDVNIESQVIQQVNTHMVAKSRIV